MGPADGNARFLNNLDTSSDDHDDGDEEYKSGSDNDDAESDESKESNDEEEGEQAVTEAPARVEENLDPVYEPSSLEDPPEVIQLPLDQKQPTIKQAFVANEKVFKKTVVEKLPNLKENLSIQQIMLNHTTPITSEE